jgi:ATP-dependent exoDNAse (exonuclease V) beta subunit
VHEVEVIAIATTREAKGSRNFGKMVHGILQYAGSAGLDAVAVSQMREYGCSQEECHAALLRVRAATSHQILANANRAERVHRELPIMLRLDDGSLIEGRADLAYFDGTRWTVVDFKTGEADGRDKAQIHLYASALHQATGRPVRAVILEI